MPATRPSVTPLLAATRANAVDAARLLIEAGANVNAKDNIRDTPFLYAGAEGRLEILRMTLKAGANLKDTNRYGGNALIPACHHGHPETVRELLKTDIDIDHINRLNWTALLETIILSDGGPTHQDILAQLIAAGANVNIADGDGVSPLAHAKQRGYAEMVAMLEKAGSASSGRCGSSSGWHGARTRRCPDRRSAPRAAGRRRSRRPSARECAGPASARTASPSARRRSNSRPRNESVLHANSRVDVEGAAAAAGPHVVELQVAEIGEDAQQPLLQAFGHDTQIASISPVRPPKTIRVGSPGARRIQSTLKFQSMKVRSPGSNDATRFSPSGAETAW